MYCYQKITSPYCYRDRFFNERDFEKMSSDNENVKKCVAVFKKSHFWKFYKKSIVSVREVSRPECEAAVEFITDDWNRKNRYVVLLGKEIVIEYTEDIDPVKHQPY